MKQLFAIVLSTAAIAPSHLQRQPLRRIRRIRHRIRSSLIALKHIAPVRPTQPMMAAMSLTGPGPRAGIPRKRSSAPQSPNRPVAQSKRRPHEGGARYGQPFGATRLTPPLETSNRSRSGPELLKLRPVNRLSY